MQRSCFLVAIQKIDFLESRKITFISGPQFAAAAIVQEYLEDISHCLEGLMPKQSLISMLSLFIPLISSDAFGTGGRDFCC